MSRRKRRGARGQAGLRGCSAHGPPHQITDVSGTPDGVQIGTWAAGRGLGQRGVHLVGAAPGGIRQRPGRGRQPRRGHRPLQPVQVRPGPGDVAPVGRRGPLPLRRRASGHEAALEPGGRRGRSEGRARGRGRLPGTDRHVRASAVGRTGTPRSASAGGSGTSVLTSPAQAMFPFTGSWRIAAGPGVLRSAVAGGPHDERHDAVSGPTPGVGTQPAVGARRQGVVARPTRRMPR